MNRIWNFIIGLLTGALIGGVLALLFTPLKGTALRARLGSSFAQVQTEVKQSARNRMNELNQQLAKMQNKTID